MVGFFSIYKIISLVLWMTSFRNIFRSKRLPFNTYIDTRLISGLFLDRSYMIENVQLL